MLIRGSLHSLIINHLYVHNIDILNNMYANFIYMVWIPVIRS